MDVGRDHVIHLENGAFAAGSSRPELNRIVSRALDAAPPAGLAIHFHGGLVNESSARDIAARLAPIYAEAGNAYPLFYVWESGVWETVRNNLDEIRREPFFQALTTKVLEWVLKKLPGEHAAKGEGGTRVDEKQLRHDMAAWFAGESQHLPELLTELRTAPVAKFKGVAIDERRLAAQIEVGLDAEFKAVTSAVYHGLHAAGEDVTTRGAGSRSGTSSMISTEAADHLFDRSPTQTRGVLSWARVAMFVAKVVMGCLHRMTSGRGHGRYPTAIEEVLRAAYADKVGTLLWESMKTDTQDAFKPGLDSGGFALLDELNAQAHAGRQFSKITLIGHSTGAIFISHFLRAAAAQLPGTVFDVVFLAPAISYQEFSDTLQHHGDSIAHFRMFGMTDTRECEDAMVKVLYPRSLLYFVSGLLEHDVDRPLVGMQRYLNDRVVFNPSDFPDVARVSAFLTQSLDHVVWSPASGGPGTSCLSASHGDFDNDPVTLASVAHILRMGF